VPQNPDAGAAFGFVDDLPLTRDAIAFAQERHSCQRRAADGAPFLLHPLEVASMLKRSRYPDHVIAAAVLHDVLEDTDAERSDLNARFGPEIAELVVLVSDDPKIDDEEHRKDDVRDRVRRVGGHALVVYAADKVSKVRELRMLIAAGLDEDKAAIKLRRYRRSLAMLEQATPASRLVELLRFEIEALETLPPARGELSAGQTA
jgi:(p)ppGpp synthase/HD superfamily hydrolase